MVTKGSPSLDPFIARCCARASCKVVGTHRVLHLGSIERERVTREWASDVPCGYYGMVYLGGVYILGVHMGHKFISFSLLAWSIG